MANRICRVFIKNSGQGTIELVARHLAHGEWVDVWDPSQSAATIAPDEEKRFASSEGGDIPIIGSIATGNEGWALYKTLVESAMGPPETAFIKIRWNLPYLAFSSDGVGVFQPEITKFDPRTSPGSAEFDTRDTSPSAARYRMFAGGDPEGDDLTEIFPVVFFVPPLVLAEANLGINVMYDFTNTAAPGSTRLPPFSTAPRPKAVPKPMINTSKAMWLGTWSGERTTVRIRQGEGDLLIVKVDDGPEQQAPISRLFLPAQLKPVTLAGASGSATFQPKAPILVQRGSDSPQLLIENVAPQLHGALQDKLVDHLGMLGMGRVAIGGDYLEIAPDTVIELCRMVSQGEWVDTALHFRRPARFPIAIAATHVDAMLYWVPDVH